jgi:serine/threonine-protein phosphatase 4 regulatory subunit 4
LYIKSTSNGILNDNLFVHSDDILNKILKFEEDLNKTHKYNIHENILISFEQLPWLISTDELVDRVLPVLESRLNSRALPIRLASIQSMLKILRKIPRLHIRNQYLIKLLEYSHHTSCYKRIMFIDICKIVYDLYSKDFFKEWFYENLIRMSMDNVTNIRIALIKLLFNLKRLLNLVQEKEKFNYLEKQVENLLRDDDKDVRDLAEKLIIHGNFLDDIKMRAYNVNELDKEKNLLKEKEEKELKEIESKKIKCSTKQGHITYFQHHPQQQQQETPKVKPRSNKLTVSSRPVNSTNTQSAKVTLKERKLGNVNGIFEENLKNTTRRNSLNNDYRTNMTKEFKINKK